MEPLWERSLFFWTCSSCQYLLVIYLFFVADKKSVNINTLEEKITCNFALFCKVSFSVPVKLHMYGLAAASWKNLIDVFSSKFCD